MYCSSSLAINWCCTTRAKRDLVLALEPVRHVDHDVLITSFIFLSSIEFPLEILLELEAVLWSLHQRKSPLAVLDYTVCALSTSKVPQQRARSVNRSVNTMGQLHLAFLGTAQVRHGVLALASAALSRDPLSTRRRDRNCFWQSPGAVSSPQSWFSSNPG